MDDATIAKNKENKENKDRTVTIIVNARQKTAQKNEELSFSRLVSLAFDVPPTGENIVFTITYRKGPDSKPEGTLIEGQTVKAKEGMIVNVSATDKS